MRGRNSGVLTWRRSEWKAQSGGAVGIPFRRQGGGRPAAPPRPAHKESSSRRPCFFFFPRRPRKPPICKCIPCRHLGGEKKQGRGQPRQTPTGSGGGVGLPFSATARRQSDNAAATATPLRDCLSARSAINFLRSVRFLCSRCFRRQTPRPHHTIGKQLPLPNYRAPPDFVEWCRLLHAVFFSARGMRISLSQSLAF